MERIILHIDMDAFFAAVEERDKPRLKGKPIVVGADPKEGKGRGVVATANYAARKYGIHSALPISTAWRLAEEARACGEPKTVFISGRHSHYDAVSKRIMAILRNYSLTIQQVSIDEAYTQLRFSIFNSQFPKKDAWKHAEEVAGKIKKDILKKEKLTCSIGIGPNKLIAKIASDAQKPDGLTIVTPSGVQTFLDPKDIRVIPGIGPKAEMVLNNMGARTISELREIPLHKLTDQLGKLGASIYQKARGDDESPLTERHEVKSISEQETYEKDTLDPIFLVGRIKELARQVHLRAMKKWFVYRTIGITVRFGDFTTKTRAHTLSAHGDDLKTLQSEALNLFLPFLDMRENPRRRKIRLLSVCVKQLKKRGNAQKLL